MRSSHAQNALQLVAAWALLPIPALGVVRFLTTDHGSAIAWGYFDGSALGGAVVIFGFALTISAVINATAVSMTMARDGALPQPTAYLVWQLITLTLGATWLACMFVGDSTFALQFWTAALIVVTSIVTCTFAMKE